MRGIKLAILAAVVQLALSVFAPAHAVERARICATSLYQFDGPASWARSVRYSAQLCSGDRSSRLAQLILLGVAY